MEEAERPVIPLRADNFPNPFRGNTTVRFALAERSDVSVDIFDVRGRLVERRGLGIQPAGVRYLDLSGLDQSAGVYFYRIQAKSEATGGVVKSYTGKMTLLR